jgi:hypothetical protein
MMARTKLLTLLPFWNMSICSFIFSKSMLKQSDKTDHDFYNPLSPLDSPFITSISVFTGQHFLSAVCTVSFNP